MKLDRIHMRRGDLVGCFGELGIRRDWVSRSVGGRGGAVGCAGEFESWSGLLMSCVGGLDGFGRASLCREYRCFAFDGDGSW